MRTNEQIIKDVEEVYFAMKNLSDHSAFISSDLYEFTRALGNALGEDPNGND